MGRELSHGEVVDLLGAYALDALDVVEREAVEGHLQGCPSCADEIVEHREVAGLLTPGWAAPPPGLWEKIAASLEEVPPPLDLAPVIAMKPRTVLGSGDRSRDRGRGRFAGPRRPLGIGIAAMVAVAAVALIGFLGVRVIDDRSQPQDVAIGQYAGELQRTVNAALAEPDARKVSLTSADGYRTAQAVILPDGTGYVVKTNLPALAKERTYQLWALVGATRVSVGVIGPEPKIVPFKMDPRATGLAITDETAGGVETTKKDPVVVGLIQSA